MLDKIRLVIFYELANFLHHVLVYLTMKQFGVSKEEANDFLGITFISYIRYKDKDDEEIKIFGEKMYKAINTIVSEKDK